MTSNDTTSGPESPTRNGFFKKMRLRRNSKKSPKRDVSNRRVVKAVAPPAAPMTEEESISTSNFTSDGEEACAHFVPEHKTIQNEVLKEKTEQWRKERLDATVANSKEKKEKEVLEHRRKMSITDHSEDVQKTGGEKVDVEPVPSILSVAPKHPEHKRKAASEDHIGKKSKFEDNEESFQEVSSKSFKALGLVKIAAPVAIVAVIAIGAVKLLRSRR